MKAEGTLAAVAIFDNTFSIRTTARPNERMGDIPPINTTWTHWLFWLGQVGVSLLIFWSATITSASCDVFQPLNLPRRTYNPAQGIIRKAGLAAPEIWWDCLVEPIGIGDFNSYKNRFQPSYNIGPFIVRPPGQRNIHSQGVVVARIKRNRANRIVTGVRFDDMGIFPIWRELFAGFVIGNDKICSWKSPVIGDMKRCYSTFDIIVGRQWSYGNVGPLGNTQTSSRYNNLLMSNAGINASDDECDYSGYCSNKLPFDSFSPICVLGALMICAFGIVAFWWGWVVMDDTGWSWCVMAFGAGLLIAGEVFFFVSLGIFS